MQSRSSKSSSPSAAQLKASLLEQIFAEEGSLETIVEFSAEPGLAAREPG